MNISHTISSVLLVLLVVLFSITGCHHRYNEKTFGFGKNSGAVNHISKELSLDSNQSLQLAELATWLEMQKEELNKKAEFRKLFVDEMKNAAINEEHLQQVSRNYFREIENTVHEFIKQLTTFHNNLSDSQKTQLAGLLENKKERWARN